MPLRVGMQISSVEIAEHLAMDGGDLMDVLTIFASLPTAKKRSTVLGCCEAMSGNLHENNVPAFLRYLADELEKRQ